MSKENVAVFEDTERLYTSNQRLKSAIQNSIAHQEVTSELSGVHGRPHDYTHVVVKKTRSFETARDYAKAGRKVCVLNFASSVNPGGGVVAGASAQEESLCRVSTLYPCLCDCRDSFYNPHISALRQGTMDARYNNDCIYTPGVVVFKSDTSNPKLLPEGEWYSVDVITCAAPNLREKPSNRYNPNGGSIRVILSDKELYDIHLERGRHILGLAASYGCDVVILGAFGCGAFKNSPFVVARAYKQLMREFSGVFETVDFAVYCSRGTGNYLTFNQVIGTGNFMVM